uniref:Uncharacterized protein n=1 Tax=Oryza brachyantha TaxID=4533 RepID=J3N8F5_ORYBR
MGQAAYLSQHHALDSTYQIGYYYLRFIMYPNLKTVIELIYKRGLGEARHHLHRGSCPQDHDCWATFKEANNFQLPFKLKAPLGGLKKKRNYYMSRVVMLATV